MVDASLQLWLTYAVIAAAVVSYCWEKWSLELTSIAVVSALAMLFHWLPLAPDPATGLVPEFGPTEIFAGFANPALIAILSLLVIGQGLVQTNAIDQAAQGALKFGGKAPALAVACALIFVTLMSAFMNNTPVVVIFIPIMTALAERMERSARDSLMPLSFAAILGGNITLIGSSTNLLVSGSMQQNGMDGLSFFDFTVPGLLLACVGMVYVLFVMPRLLRLGQGEQADDTQEKGHQFIVQLRVRDGSTLVGQRAIAGMFPNLGRITVRMIERDGSRFLPPYDDIEMKVGDKVVLATTRRVLIDLLTESPQLLPSGTDISNSAESEADQTMIAEIVVAPASRMDGRTIAQTGFRDQTNCTIIGIQRRARMIRGKMMEIRLEAGDVLLVLGRRRNVLALRENADVLLLEWSAKEFTLSTRPGIALAIFFAVVGASAFDILPISIAAMAGAGAMVTLGCLNVRQAARAVDRRILLLIGAALAMGASLEVTGGAAYLAHGLTSLVMDQPPQLILSLLFLLVAALTNILSNNATAALFTPIAISLAHELSLDALPFIVTVIFAANCSFATPISYQTNLLVMGPGRYRFQDFLRVGLPMIFLLWVTFTLFVPGYYGL
ncbi:MAG: SLC13 family permease [Pseudomonadota bacterium]